MHFKCQPIGLRRGSRYPDCREPQRNHTQRRPDQFGGDFGGRYPTFALAQDLESKPIAGTGTCTGTCPCTSPCTSPCTRTNNREQRR
jgi:hypothetical protein